MEAFYARIKGRFVESMLALAALVTLTVTTIHTVAVLHYFDAGDTAGLAAALLGGGLLLAAVPTGVAAARWLRPMLDWQRGADSPEAAGAAWDTVTAGVPRLVALGTALVAACFAPAELIIARANDLPPFSLAMVLVQGFLVTVCGGIMVYLVIEQFARPALREIAAQLPVGFVPPRRSISLGARLAGLLIAINVYAALLVLDVTAGLVPGAQTLVAVAISLTLPLAAALLLRRSLLLRLDDIRGGLAAIREGDLEARIAKVADDEIGELADTFNDMAARLERHDGEMRASRARIVAAADASRRAVERDLHDGAQQHLVLLRLKLGQLERAAKDDPALTGSVADLKAELDRALAALRELAHGIYPASLTNGGIAAALRESGAEVADGTTGRHDPDVEAAVYFCCLEALQNAAKHAPGATVRVTVAEDDGELTFVVRDDGPGFDRAAVDGSAGLQNLADRMGALGGSVRVDSAPGRGTTVAGRVPVAQGASRSRAQPSPERV